MDADELRSSLARLASDLTLAGEPIALDAVVSRHLNVLQTARSAKLRWASIAKILATAGARRLDGGPISADQLRASYSRAVRQLCWSTRPDRDASERTPPGEKRSASALPRDNSILRRREQKSDLGKAEAAESILQRHVEPSKRPPVPDFTDAELALARARLKPDKR